MANKLEERVAVLERQVATLRNKQKGQATTQDWLKDIYGKFESDPLFDQAMKLGRKYRQSLRPRGHKIKPTG